MAWKFRSSLLFGFCGIIANRVIELRLARRLPVGSPWRKRLCQNSFRSCAFFRRNVPERTSSVPPQRNVPIGTYLCPLSSFADFLPPLRCSLAMLFRFESEWQCVRNLV